jgi:HSP20 family protein
MTNMIQWEPFNELRSTMDRLFDQGFARPWRFITPQDYQSSFPVEVWETDDAVGIRAALPGIRPEDVDISVIGDSVTIKAQRLADEHESGTYYVREVQYGAYQRTFTLPVGVEADKADARYEHGMLQLKLPKAESVRPKQIRIGTGHGTNGNLLSSG